MEGLILLSFEGARDFCLILSPLFDEASIRLRYIGTLCKEA